MNLNEQTYRIKQMMGILHENEVNQVYYRAIYEFKGNNLTFEPNSFHEATDDDGNLIYKTGNVVMMSNVPEISASKSIGGAVLGLWSMLHQFGKPKTKAYLYKINNIPYKDLSNNRSLDFEYLKEVRFNKPVNGEYIGEFNYSEEFNDGADLLYTYLSDDEPWNELNEFEMETLHKFIDNLDKITI